MYVQVDLLFANQDNLIYRLFHKRIDNTTQAEISHAIDRAFNLAFTNPDSALFFVDAAIAKSFEFSYDKGISDAFQTKGIVYYAVDRYDSSIHYFNQAILYREKLGDLNGIAASYSNIALSYTNLSDYKNAIQYNLNALKIREETKDSSGLSKSLNNLGMCYHNLGQYQQALEYYKNALNLKSLLEGNGEISSTLNNIGIIYHELGDNNPGFFDSSFNYLNQALEIKKIDGNIQGISESFVNLGNLFLKWEKYDDALFYIDRAMETFEATSDKYGMATAFYNRAIIFQGKDEFAKALKEFDKSIKLAEEIGNLDILMDIYLSLSKLYFSTNEYGLAYEYIEKYNEIKDSFSSVETKKEIVKLQSLYEIQKKENTILKQKSDIEKLQLKKSRYFIILNIIITLTVILVIYLVRKNLNKTKHFLSVVENKNMEISKKNEIISDSIKKAKTIQKEIIPAQQIFKKAFVESFIIDKPKEIIGGDFLWMYEGNGFKILAVVDCIGHGIPGSIMTIAGNFLLDKIITEHKIYSPEDILDELEEAFFQYFSKEIGDPALNSMDVGICYVDSAKVEFAGAKIPLVRVSNKVIEFHKSSIYPIGRFKVENGKDFRNCRFQANKGDSYYMLTDGYFDQFGGDGIRQIGKKRFLDLLEDIYLFPMEYQKASIINYLEKWRDKRTQVDDVFIVGFRL